MHFFAFPIRICVGSGFSSLGLSHCIPSLSFLVFRLDGDSAGLSVPVLRMPGATVGSAEKQLEGLIGYQ